jgi:DnaD/phage-associated family protein
MNYIEEINKFRKYMILNPLPANAQSLWYLLMDINNKCAWAEWFRASNIRLAKELCLSEKTIRNLRKTLVESELIIYISQQRKKESGLYKMVTMSGKVVGNDTQTAVIITAESESDAQTAVTITAESESDVQTAVTITAELETAVIDTAVLEENQKTAVTVTNITKRSSNSSSTTTMESDFLDVIKFFNENIREITPYEESEIKNWNDEFTNEILIKAIKISIENDKRTMKYICGILRNWSSMNLKTISEIDASMKVHTSNRNATNVTQLNSHKKIHNFNERPKYSNDELEKKLGIKK